MFEPVRGGTRGGQAEFKWSDVSADKDRENYLGHSINAPTGRWQKNKDVHWYNRDVKDGELERQEEIRKAKEAEAEVMGQILGFQKSPTDELPSSGSNSIPVKPRESTQKDEDREARQLRKAARAAKREERSHRRQDRDSKKHKQRDRRSQSPAAGRIPRARSRSPVRKDSYDESAREAERENNRRAWDRNSRRDRP